MSEKIPVSVLVEDLLGTCMGDFDVDDYTRDELIEIDSHVFRCETCGWWCSTDDDKSEDQDEETCKECYEDQEAELL